MPEKSKIFNVVRYFNHIIPFHYKQRKFDLNAINLKVSKFAIILKHFQNISFTHKSCVQIFIILKENQSDPKELKRRRKKKSVTMIKLMIDNFEQEPNDRAE